MYKDREGKITDPLTVHPNILIFYCAELSGKFDGFGSQDFHLVPPVLVFDPVLALALRRAIGDPSIGPLEGDLSAQRTRALRV